MPRVRAYEHRDQHAVVDIVRTVFQEYGFIWEPEGYNRDLYEAFDVEWLIPCERGQSEDCYSGQLNPRTDAWYPTEFWFWWRGSRIGYAGSVAMTFNFFAVTSIFSFTGIDPALRYLRAVVGM